MNILAKCYLSELLPYDPSIKFNGSLKASLTEYNLLLTGMQKAIAAFREGDLEQFDALVGENACQIRAVKIAMLYSSAMEGLESTLTAIESAMLKVEEFSKLINKLMSKGISLSQLLRESDLEVCLTQDEFFLLESFLLTLAKTVKSAKPFAPLCMNEAINPKKLQLLEPQASSSFTESLVRKVRQRLSAASVVFVQEQAKLIADTKLVEMSTGNFILNYKSWSCIPMFWTYKTLLASVQNNGIPVIIYGKSNKTDSASDEGVVFFKQDPNQTKVSYRATVPVAEDLEKAAIVVQGVVCGRFLPSDNQWKAIIADDKLDVILAGAADHRQYPDANEDKRVKALGDVEFKAFKEMAKSNGYALKNPSTFFIQHVYCSIVGCVPPFIKIKEMNNETTQ